MMRILLWVPVGLLCLPPCASLAQAPRSEEIVKATDLRIPSAPAFVLLGVNPASVATPGLIKDFKLDLLVNDEGLRPDIAVAARPIWTFLFRDVSRSEYVERTTLQRTLSTLGLSLGTAARDTVMSLGWAVTLNLVRRDPLLDPDYVQRVGATLDIGPRQTRLAEEFATRRVELIRARAQVRSSGLSAAQQQAALDSLDAVATEQLATYTVAVEGIEEELTRELVQVVENYRREHWNAPAIDAGFGRIYRYDDLSLDGLRLQETGYGAWLSGASGLNTRRWLFSAMIRHLDLMEGSGGLSVGANARYGGPTSSFFVEVLTVDGDLDNRELAYGGEFELAEGMKVEFGLRTQYRSDLSLSDLTPVVKLHWNGKERRLSDFLQGISQ